MSDLDSRKGNVVIGIMLVAIGIWVALSRSGEFSWGQTTLWPLILGGIGLARFVSTPPGEPRQGLIFMAAGAWLFAGQAAWLSLRDTWPLLVIAFGLIIAFNPGRRRAVPEIPAEAAAAVAAVTNGERWSRRRRHHRPHGVLSPLAVLGIWIAIFVGVQVSGVGFRGLTARSSTDDQAHVVSVMGRSEYTSRATRFRAAEVTNLMGRAELDLRNAQIPPGGEATMEVFSAMGAVIVRVPPDWTVDTRAIPAMGAVRDERFPPTEPGTSSGPAPRLVLRGVILMGRLTIAS